MAMFDTDMRYLAASGEWLKYYKLEGKPVIGQSIYDVYGLSAHWRAILDECLKGATHQGDEHYFENEEGTGRWINWDIRPWWTEEGGVGGLMIATVDVTQQKQKEGSQRRLEESLGRINDIARIGAWEINLNTREVIWSDVVKQILDLPEDFVPWSGAGFSFFKGVNHEKITRALSDAIELGHPYDLELEVVTAKGRTIWVRSVGQSDFANGKCERVFGIFQDIDRQKRMQEELQVSENRFRGAFEHSAIGMALVSTTGRWLQVNNELCRMLGYESEELLTKTFLDITHPEDLGKDLSNLSRMLSHEIDAYKMEKRYFHKDGSIIWVLLNVSLVTKADGSPLHFVSQMEDITQRKKAEQSLLEINRELTAILNTGHVCIINTNVNGTITHFSKGAELLLGYRADELVGRHTPLILYSEQEARKREADISRRLDRETKGFESLVAVARDDRYESREAVYRRKDGTDFPVHLVVTALTDESGAIKGYLGIATDITERKQAEETRRKLAAVESRSRELEQFAYIASHDLREPLLTIQSYIDIMLEDHRQDLPEDALSCLEAIAGSSARMEELIKGLLDYSRLNRLEGLVQVDAAAVLADAQADLITEIRAAGARITADDLPTLTAYRPGLKQVFQNLISNAVKFRREALAPRIHISSRSVDGHWHFTVADNGIGIPEHQREKIFIIFQRLHNRHAYPGTGIGLAHCKKIVELHHGAIWVNEAPGGGSEFHFTIPN